VLKNRLKIAANNSEKSTPELLFRMMGSNLMKELKKDGKKHRMGLLML
jgi:hypothetical protein